MTIFVIADSGTIGRAVRRHFYWKSEGWWEQPSLRGVWVYLTRPPAEFNQLVGWVVLTGFGWSGRRWVGLPGMGCADFVRWWPVDGLRFYIVTKLADWIGSRVALLDNVPIIILIIAVTTLIIFLTELTSNTGPVPGSSGTGYFLLAESRTLSKPQI